MNSQVIILFYIPCHIYSYLRILRVGVCSSRHLSVGSHWTNSKIFPSYPIISLSKLGPNAHSILPKFSDKNQYNYYWQCLAIVSIQWHSDMVNGLKCLIQWRRPPPFHIGPELCKQDVWVFRFSYRATNSTFCSVPSKPAWLAPGSLLCSFVATGILVCPQITSPIANSEPICIHRITVTQLQMQQKKMPWIFLIINGKMLIWLGIDWPIEKGYL